MSFEQKRNAERLPLDQPLEATAGGSPVTIVEMSAIGCKIEHREKLSIGSSTTLRFRWRGEDIELRAKVARTQLRSAYPKGMIYESGLQFADVLENAPDVIRRILASAAEAELPPAVVETAPAPFIREEFDEVIEATEEIESAPEVVEELPKEAELRFVECRLENRKWERRLVATVLQPAEGFITLPADEGELDMLCKTYEYADPDTRRLIRISLELSATQKKD